jgi:diguanylate cyclase (GGDEF)-like protein/PAS domain S-box-containing protein
MQLGKDSYERVLENLYDGLYFVDRNRVITYWNKAAERISGFSAEEVVGKSCADGILTHVDGEGKYLCGSRCPMAATISDGRPREMEIYLHHKAGHRVPVFVRASALTDAANNIIGGIELFTDISNRPANEMRLKELEQLAMLDGLTQLANRNYVKLALRTRFEEMKRFGVPFGILFMDIDLFKKFNDTHGHDAGDAVLKFAANTLVENCRPFDLYGRWGGEEFIGIIRNIDRQGLANAGNRARSLVAESYLNYENKRLKVTLSVGATLLRESDSEESLLKRADALLYQSKSAGRNCLTID